MRMGTLGIAVFGKAIIPLVGYFFNPYPN